MDRTPFNPVRHCGGRKLMYCTRNAKLIPVALEFPGHLDDVTFAPMLVLKAEHYVHDEWHPIRTSIVLSENFNGDTTLDLETRNSVYHVVDGSIKDVDMITARIEALFETTFIKGCHAHMPEHEQLVELFDSHAMYAYFKTDDRLVNALADIVNSDAANLDTDYAIRLAWRQPLRRFLTLFVENGGETQCNLSFERN